MLFRIASILCLVIIAAGCQTPGPGVHQIPVTRDYARLEKVSLDDAARYVREAQRRGAALASPYEYASALHYLAIARDEARRGNRPAAWDYAGLAKQMSEVALRNCPPAPSGAVRPEPSASYDDCVARFEEAKASYDLLDSNEAIERAPFVFAHLTSTLSRAEHALQHPANWRRADAMLELAEYDINTLLRDDVDVAPVAREDDGELPELLAARPDSPEVLAEVKEEDGEPEELPLLEPVLFAPDSSELTAEAEGYLRGLRFLLVERPDLQLRVAGHANPSADESDAMDLSLVRAENVRQYLLERGVPHNQLVVTFYGATQLAAEPGRHENARVELQLE